MNYKRWDPAGFDTSNVLPYEMPEFYKIIIKFYWLIYLVPIALILTLVPYFLSDEPVTMVIYMIGGIFGVVSGMYGFFTKIKKNTIKNSIAKKNNWVFSGLKNADLYNLYSSKFPRIFDLGEVYKNLEGVFWGQYSKNGETFDFVLGNFNYAEVRSSGRSSSTVRYTDHFFIIRLNTDISTNFYLRQKNMGFRLFGRLARKKITTESIDFNNAFSFSYESNGGNTEVSILSVLSPVLLEELVAFSNKKKSWSKRSLGGVRVFFKKDCVAFTAPGTLLKTKGGFTPKSLEVKESDIAEVQEELDFFLDLGIKMSNNLSDSAY